MYRRSYAAKKPPEPVEGGEQGEPRESAFWPLATTMVILSTLLQLAFLFSWLFGGHSSGGGNLNALGAALLTIGLVVIFVPIATVIAFVQALRYSARQAKEGGVRSAVAFFWFATFLPFVTFPLSGLGRL